MNILKTAGIAKLMVLKLTTTWSRDTSERMFASAVSTKYDRTAYTIVKTVEVAAAASKMIFSDFFPDFYTGILILSIT
jgi:hypothetical protein